MAKSQKFALPLPKKAIEADEVAKEKSYDEFYKELYVLFKKDKGERKPKLVKQVREHLKTFEGKKLLFDLLEHFEKRKDKYYNADQEKIIKIIKEEILIATKLPKDWKKKEAPQSDLPESLIPLDKTEENQDNTHVKSFKPFFLTTPEQQREVQLEADLSKAEQKIAQLEKEREETFAVLATLTEENRCRLEQIKELELRVEEAESVAFKSRENNKADSLPDNAPKIMLPEIDDEYDRLKNWLEERGWLEQITYYNPKKKTEPKEEIVCKADYRFLTRDTEKETAETIYDDIFKDWLVAGNHIFQFYLGGKKGLMPKLLQGLKNQLKHSLNKSIPPKKNWVDKTIQDEDYKKLNRKVMALRLRM